MPDILGVQSLQEACMDQFCLHLSELAITSDRILAAQAPQQEAARPAEPEVKDVQRSGGRTPQEESQWAARSDGSQETGLVAGAYDGGGAERQDLSDGPPVGENNTTGKVGKEAGECGKPAVVQKGGLNHLYQTGHGTLEEAEQDRNDVEQQQQQQEVRTYLLRNVPPCFFEQMVHDTLTIINKHFYNPK